MQESLDEKLEFLAAVVPQLDESSLLEYQRKMQSDPHERVADAFFDDSNSERRREAEAFLEAHGTDLTIGQAVEIRNTKQQ